MKTDDDVFVNLRNLALYCFQQNQDFQSKMDRDEEKMMTGKEKPGSSKPFHFISGVIHSDRGAHTWNPFSKWYAPQNLWNSVYSEVVKLKGLNIRASRYPPYAEGNFYVLSDDAALDILEASRQLPLYHLEDVFVTGVVATWILGIEKKNMASVSSASNIFPVWSYWWFTKFTGPEDIIAFHCDKNVGLISMISRLSLLS